MADYSLDRRLQVAVVSGGAFQRPFGANGPKTTDTGSSPSLTKSVLPLSLRIFNNGHSPGNPR